MAIQQLHNGTPDGSRYGQNTGERIGFYGRQPVPQPQVSAIGTTAISQIGTSGIWGFASSTAATAFVTRMTAIQTGLHALGLVDNGTGTGGIPSNALLFDGQAATFDGQYLIFS